ncbi:MAG: hypothetical protein C0621_08910 [Desulfuromonas sp.]|nr:MAG: hypothetical protein C0621_08910 [Desulfuromonas sp.]
MQKLLIFLTCAVFLTTPALASQWNEIQFGASAAVGESQSGPWSDDFSRTTYGLGYTIYLPGLDSDDYDYGYSYDVPQPRRLKPFLQHPSHINASYFSWEYDWDDSADTDGTETSLGGKYYTPTEEWATGFGVSYSKDEDDWKSIRFSVDQYIEQVFNIEISLDSAEDGAWEADTTTITGRAFLFDILWTSLSYAQSESEWMGKSNYDEDRTGFEIGLYPGSIYSVILNYQKRDRDYTGGGSREQTYISLSNNFWFTDSFAMETELFSRKREWTGGDQEYAGLALDFIIRF